MFAPPGSRVEPSINTERSSNSYRKWTWAEKVVIFMTEMGITRRDLDKIPAAVNLLIHEALWQCRENPPTDWSSYSYYLLQRPDLAVQAQHSTQVIYLFHFSNNLQALIIFHFDRTKIRNDRIKHDLQMLRPIYEIYCQRLNNTTQNKKTEWKM